MALPDYDTFKGLTFTKIIEDFKNDKNALIFFLQQQGLLAPGRFCEKCQKNMHLLNTSFCIDGKMWRCSKCKAKVSIRRGSFFEKSHLQLWQIFAFTNLWSASCGSARGLRNTEIQSNLEIGSPRIVVDWNAFCRDVCIDYFVENPVQLGGAGVTVQIDESIFVKRKYHRGRFRKEQWVFGAYEPHTKRGLLVPVDKRDAQTLLPIIAEHILPGSVIWSDMWKAYNQLSSAGYHHDTVNHSRNFVDPNTGVHTNLVESMWSRAKAKFKAMNGTNRNLVGSYLVEYMWSQRFGEVPFYHFWNQVAARYEFY